MSKYIFNLPDIGEGIAEAEIVAWHVKVGDMVEEDAPVADMMTDKATVEMEAPVSGRIVAVAGEAGDVIAIGSMLVTIEMEGDGASEVETEGENRSTSSPAHAGAQMPAEPENLEVDLKSPEESSPVSVAPFETHNSEEDRLPPAPGHAATKILASPAVRKRAAELGVDLNEVKPSGGHIRHADLDAYITYGSSEGYHQIGKFAQLADEVQKVIGLRRKIAENMAASKRHIPHFSYVEEIDVTLLEDMRGDLNANRGARPKLTLLPLLIVAICKVIPEFRMINATYDDEAGVLTRHGAINLGIATQTDQGLMVPVVRDAQDKNVWQLAREIGNLADGARAGIAKPSELSGSTLTVTSLGPLGGIATTPVINRPEVAIIGPNKIVERPVIVDGELEARKLMNLSISCDHRAVDGYDAARFVQALKHLLETPVLLFAD